MRKFFLFLLILPVAVLSWAQDASDNFIIEKDNAWIRVPANEKSQVMLAVQALQKDFKKVMNFTPAIVQSGETGTGVRIVVVNDENPDGKALIDNPRDLDDFERWTSLRAASSCTEKTCEAPSTLSTASANRFWAFRHFGTGVVGSPK